jgi:hypothetical protein
MELAHMKPEIFKLGCSPAQEPRKSQPMFAGEAKPKQALNQSQSPHLCVSHLTLVFLCVVIYSLVLCN